MKKYIFYLVLTVFISITACTSVKVLATEELFLEKKQAFLESFTSLKEKINLPRNTKVDNINADHKSRQIRIDFSKELSSLPFRPDDVEKFYSIIKNSFGNEFSDYQFELYSMNYLIDELIPNYYRTDKFEIDKKRLPVNTLHNRIPVTENISKPFTIANGLYKSNILLWHSHGWYYNNKERRWEWQRPRLFQIVEDLLPASFTIPYLIPMLENAGANVFVPRERDIQTNEVIVDNDLSDGYSYIEKSDAGVNWQTSDLSGFGMKKFNLKGNDNPFTMGTVRFIESSEKETARISWLPDIPETGYYAVYISYQSSEENVSDARYTVHHSGGKTEFSVNQKIGGGTWIYLGKFHFHAGQNENQGVVLSNQSQEKNKIVSADAVRFGGGMGIVERDGKTSGRPKFMEGSRYWLQFAGMPDSLVYNLNSDSDDYKDDYQSRAEYGNYLYGNPFGPNKDKSTRGLSIPIDVSLAFHTDAGITRSDTVVGTLMIYSIPGLDSLHFFPDNVSRLANRDLADIVQSQIVEDIRIKYDSVWTRRQLMNSLYSEAARPNYPSMLLELLAHQNFFDMKFALDPRFRFDVSRSIYKGILRFVSYQNGYDYTVQPLPVEDFSTQLFQGGKLKISWNPVTDETEPTAVPEKYIVYTRIDNNGFDNGTVVDSNSYIIDKLEEGKLYSFKVTAINKGGESFPSEILSACWLGENKNIALIVNGFNRVSPPASVETKIFSGFTDFIDEGVPYKYDIGYTGSQYNFDPESKWLSDDRPGHGASSSNFENEIIAGNSFDYPALHGKSIVLNGLSFCSASSSSVINGSIHLNKYLFVDLILGEQKKTPMPKYQNIYEFEALPEALQINIKDYLNNGGKIMISGAYIASDLYSTDDDSISIRFANEVLKITLRSGYAVKSGKVYSINDEFFSSNQTVEFNTAFNKSVYKVEAPDAIAGINGGEILMRYLENNFSAAVGYKGNYGVVTFGFPFETIAGESKRREIMKAVLNYLEVNR